jgi:hypothetical protein
MNLLKLKSELEVGKKFHLRVNAWHQLVFFSKRMEKNKFRFEVINLLGEEEDKISYK